jgi:hypothetical protein
MNNGKIDGLLIATECGNYSLSSSIVIDASGNGSIAAMAGCKWECGDPHEGRPSPASMGVCVVGMPENYNGTDTKEDKDAYGEMLSSNGIFPSSTQGSCQKLPSLKTWSLGLNFQYDVRPDDIFSLSNATLDGRREIFEIIENTRSYPDMSLFIPPSQAPTSVLEKEDVFSVNTALRTRISLKAEDLMTESALLPSVLMFTS